MSRDWTSEELQAVSKAMKAAGHLSYEEFCEKLEAGEIRIVGPSSSRAEDKPDEPS